jgi:hypothetical protein
VTMIVQQNDRRRRDDSVRPQIATPVPGQTVSIPACTPRNTKPRHIAGFGGDSSDDSPKRVIGIEPTTFSLGTRMHPPKNPQETSASLPPPAVFPAVRPGTQPTTCAAWPRFGPISPRPFEPPSWGQRRRPSEFHDKCRCPPITKRPVLGVACSGLSPVWPDSAPGKDAIQDAMSAGRSLMPPRVPQRWELSFGRGQSLETGNLRRQPPTPSVTAIDPSVDIA